MYYYTKICFVSCPEDRIKAGLCECNRGFNKKIGGTYMSKRKEKIKKILEKINAKNI